MFPFFSPLAAFAEVWTTKNNRAHQPCFSVRDVFYPRNFDCGAFYMNRMSGSIPIAIPTCRIGWRVIKALGGVSNPEHDSPPIVERIESRLDLGADFAAVLVGHKAVAVGALSGAAQR